MTGTVLGPVGFSPRTERSDGWSNVAFAPVSGHTHSIGPRAVVRLDPSVGAVAVRYPATLTSRGSRAPNDPPRPAPTRLARCYRRVRSPNERTSCPLKSTSPSAATLYTTCPGAVDRRPAHVRHGPVPVYATVSAAPRACIRGRHAQRIQRRVPADTLHRIDAIRRFQHALERAVAPLSSSDKPVR